MPSKSELVGRRIVDFDPGVSRGKYKTFHSPTIYLDDGTFLRFMAEEDDEDGGEAGTFIVRGGTRNA